MDTNTPQESLSDHRIDAEREIIRLCLDEIVQELGVKMRQAGLSDPVFVTVPSSGLSLMTMATPVDPSLGDWNQIVKIISVIVSDRLDGIGVRSQELPCAMVSATMSAADIIED